VRGGVRIRIRPDGTVSAETTGVTGDACLDWVPLVEEATGAVIVGSEYLPEFFLSGEAELVEDVEEVEEQGQQRS
jgi:hypothetical protein